MDRLAHAQRCFDGRNAHDAEAIAATFAPGRTQCDRTVRAADDCACGAALPAAAVF